MVDPDINLVDLQLEVKKPRVVVEVCILETWFSGDSYSRFVLEARRANGPQQTFYLLLSKAACDGRLRLFYINAAVCVQSYEELAC